MLPLPAQCFFGIRKFWETFFIHSKPLAHWQNHHPGVIKYLHLFQSHIIILVYAFTKMAGFIFFIEPPILLVIVIWLIKKNCFTLISYHQPLFPHASSSHCSKFSIFESTCPSTTILDQLLHQPCFRRWFLLLHTIEAQGIIHNSRIFKVYTALPIQLITTFFAIRVSIPTSPLPVLPRTSLWLISG